MNEELRLTEDELYHIEDAHPSQLLDLLAQCYEYGFADGAETHPHMYTHDPLFARAALEALFEKVRTHQRQLTVAAVEAENAIFERYYSREQTHAHTD